MVDEERAVPDRIGLGQVWRTRDGAALYVCGAELVPPYGVRLRDAVQDDRGRWRYDQEADVREVSEEWLRSNCTLVPPPPEPPDPRIARLAELVDELVAGYAAAAAGAVPAPGQVERLTDAVRAALTDVAEIPEQERRRRHGAARLAASTAYAPRATRTLTLQGIRHTAEKEFADGAPNTQPCPRRVGREAMLAARSPALIYHV